MAQFPFLQTRSQLIERAFRLIGALSLGEVLSGEGMSQGVTALNAMVKSWQNDHTFLWTVQVLGLRLYKHQCRYPLTAIVPPIITIDAMWIEGTGLSPITPWETGRAVALNEAVSASGNVYSASASGAMGSFEPSVNGQGIGQDGTVSWQFVDVVSWQTNQPYAAGDHVRNLTTDEYFVATASGTSAPSGTGPTGSGTGIVDGTIVWSSFTVQTWAAGTAYVVGDYAATGNYYRAESSGTSGQYGPNWSPTGSTYYQSDSDTSALYWIFQYSLPAVNPKRLVETHLERLAYRDYQQFVAQKGTYGFPSHFAADNQRTPELYVYPAPDADYEVFLLAVCKVKDWDSADSTGDFPVRWTDALTYGLAANLGDEYGIPIGERQSLGQKAAMLYKDAKRGGRDGSDEEFVRGAFQ